MTTLREKIEVVNNAIVRPLQKLQGFYLFFNTGQEDYTKAKTRLEAAKKFQRANKRLTGNTVPLETVIKFVEPEQRSIIL